jgi:hypothetical protein
MSVPSLQVHGLFFVGSVHSVLNWDVVVLIGSSSLRARQQDVWYQIASARWFVQISFWEHLSMMSSVRTVRRGAGLAFLDQVIPCP